LRRRDFLELYKAADSLSSQEYEDATSHFVANQFCLLIKKYPWPSDKLDLGPRDNAVRHFGPLKSGSRESTQSFSSYNIIPKGTY